MNGARGSRSGLVRLDVPEFVLEGGPPATCRTDPDAYFADGVRAGRARELCSGCSYLEACRAYALERPSVWGVWGGMTRGARESARRRAAEGRGPPSLR